MSAVPHHVSQPIGEGFSCALPAASWEASGKGLDSQGLTAWQASHSALTLVTTVAGVEQFADAFNAQVSAVRGGVDPLKCATVYLPRNVTNAKRRVLANIFVVAAKATSYRDMVNRLVWACSSPTSVRRVSRESLASLDGSAIPMAGDRRKAFRDGWKVTVTHGARLIALRGSLRCLACECNLEADEIYREQLDADRRVRADYCSNCLSNDDDPDHRAWAHRHAIRSVLDAAAPALTRAGVDTSPWDR